MRSPTSSSQRDTPILWGLEKGAELERSHILIVTLTPYQANLPVNFLSCWRLGRGLCQNQLREELRSLISRERLCFLSSLRESNDRTLPVHCHGHHQIPASMVQMCASIYRRGKRWNKRTFTKVVSSLDHSLRFWGQNRNKVMANRQSHVWSPFCQYWRIHGILFYWC